MKGFLLDENGDLVLNRDGLPMTSGIPLLCQTCRQVIGTNQGEWFLNGAEGINFDHILTKRPDHALIRDEVQGGLYQVDRQMHIDRFSVHSDDGRRLQVQFTAKDSKGNTIEGGTAYDY